MISYCSGKVNCEYRDKETNECNLKGDCTFKIFKKDDNKKKKRFWRR